MSKISLSPEQYDLLKKGGMQNFFKELSEDMYEIVPLQDDEDFCMECYEREQRENALSSALHVPVKCLQELFDNAEKIRRWVEGDV